MGDGVVSWLIMPFLIHLLSSFRRSAHKVTIIFLFADRIGRICGVEAAEKGGGRGREEG